VVASGQVQIPVKSLKPGKQEEIKQKNLTCGI
jgi:hypothetical protein